MRAFAFKRLSKDLNMKKQLLMMIASTFLIGAFWMGTTHAASHDGEIVAVLIAANNNEIAVADLALEKASSPEVKHYADTLKIQHAQNLKDTLLLKDKEAIKPEQTAAIKHLEKKGQADLKKLSTKNSTQFDKDYINAMIKGHKELLKEFDHKLLRQVKNNSLKELLITTRPHIEAHLEEAQKIQKSLK